MKTRPNVVFKLAPNHLQNATEFDDALISTQRKRTVLLVYYHGFSLSFNFFFVKIYLRENCEFEAAMKGDNNHPTWTVFTYQ